MTAAKEVPERYQYLLLIWLSQRYFLILCAACSVHPIVLFKNKAAEPGDVSCESEPSCAVISLVNRNLLARENIVHLCWLLYSPSPIMQTRRNLAISLVNWNLLARIYLCPAFRHDRTSQRTGTLVFSEVL
jgi:hypothetical protein